MKPQYHAASSALIAGILYLFFKSWSMALSCFISGILIDIDHVYDFVKETGFPFEWKKMYGIICNNDITHWTIVFHSWELVFLLAISAWFTDWNPWITGVSAGFGHHVMMDVFHNEVTIPQYSFVWRLKNNFVIK